MTRYLLQHFSRLTRLSILILLSAALLSAIILNATPEPAVANSLVKVHRSQIANKTTASPVSSLTSSTPAQPVPASCTPLTSPALSAPTLDPSSTNLAINNVSDVSYAVHGDTVDQIYAQINNCGPVSESSGGNRFSASTDYTLSWDYSAHQNNDGQCAIDTVAVGISIRQTYPAWLTSSAASPATQVAWRNFQAGLHTHEAGHAQIDRDAANALLQKLQNLAPTDCTMLDQAVKTVVENSAAATDQANSNYDAITQHGRTQGAIL